jgi:hypothetical protein
MPIFAQIINQYIFWILLVLLIILIGNIVALGRLRSKLKSIEDKNQILFSGKKVTNLDELLLTQAKNIRDLDKDIQELYNISNKINSLAGRGLHKIGLVRFNPFRDIGGDQSFAIALLNGKNNGLTLSSLYSREGTRIYAKSIVSGESEKYPLTEEEKQAIEEAIERRMVPEKSVTDRSEKK